MEVGQGPNVGCSAKEKKVCFVVFYSAWLQLDYFALIRLLIKEEVARKCLKLLRI
jgi:hypothetical protein